MTVSTGTARSHGPQRLRTTTDLPRSRTGGPAPQPVTRHELRSGRDSPGVSVHRGRAGGGRRRCPRTGRREARTPLATRIRPLPTRSPFRQPTGRPQRHRPLGTRVLNLGITPLEPVFLQLGEARKRGPNREWVKPRALVMGQAADGELARAGSAAHSVGGLQDRHFHACGRQRDGGREPVGPAADDDGSGHDWASSTMCG